MKKSIAILVSALSLAACDLSKENWPTHTLTQEQKKLGLSNAFQYRKEGLNADHRSQTYSSTGDYLNYGRTVFHRPSKTLHLDDQGVPMVFQGGKFNYSAGTVAIAALAEHGRSLDSKDNKQFFILANKLLSLMSEDGALRYAYPYRHYTSTQAMAAGWTSGMDQGMAMSVFARAFAIDKDKKWLDAGNKALKFLQTPYPNGPMSTLKDLDASLSNRVFFLEYPVEPNVFTLNGYMFTLIGLYDWATEAKSTDAQKIFNDGIETLKKLLPYYDLGTFSAYDLSYITHSKLPYLQPRAPHIAPRYHAIHIAQLRALNSVTGEQLLKETAEKWQGYAKGNQ